MKYYLVGPMTGYPQFNFPLFKKAAKALRKEGMEIISPAELDSKQTKREAKASKDGKLVDGKIGGETWGQILGRDVEVIADQVDGIVFLDGWTASRGARLEATVGLLQPGFLFYNYSVQEKVVSAFSREAVAQAVHRQFMQEFA
jgi:Domain of unknown function (DUF4406)